MFSKKPIRWAVVILGVLVFIEFAIIIVVINLFTPLGGFDGKTVRPVDNFAYDNTLDCSIVYSTHVAGQGLSLPWGEITTFTLRDLDTEAPLLESSSHNSPTKLRKVYDTDDYITLVPADASWDTDTIGLMKKNGSFVRTVTGDQAGMWEFHYAIAQKGRCE